MTGDAAGLGSGREPADAAGSSLMRDRIKAVAEGLLVTRGYRGVSFREIAEILNTTRANLHYHFGNKAGLVEEVLHDYARGTLDRYSAIWTDPATSLRDKVAATVAFNRERYVRYNTPIDQGNAWSLMSRLRSDSDVLTPKMRGTLKNAMREFELYVSIGVENAVRAGELVATTPQDQVVIQLVTVIYYAGSVTRDSGRFARLDELWEATLATIERAYGTAQQPVSVPPGLRPTAKRGRRG